MVNRDLILKMMAWNDAGNGKPLSQYADTLARQLLDRDDIATRFTSHINAIWNAAFPDDPDGWEYGGQIERCVIDKIEELRAENARLREFAQQQIADFAELTQKSHRGHSYGEGVQDTMRRVADEARKALGGGE